MKNKKPPLTRWFFDALSVPVVVLADGVIRNREKSYTKTAEKDVKDKAVSFLLANILCLVIPLQGLLSHTVLSFNFSLIIAHNP